MNEEAKRLEPIERSAHIGRVWAWAHDPANATDSLAESVRVLLEQCSYLANLVPDYEIVRMDREIAQRAVAALRHRLAGLQAQFDAEPVPWDDV